MTSFSSLRTRLAGAVLIAIVPAWVVAFWFNLPWSGLLVGLLALGAAWFVSEWIILPQIARLKAVAGRLAGGQWSARTGLADEGGELGELGQTIDDLAGSVEKHLQERDQSERTLLNRALQQTVVSALGQFALISNDFYSLLNQAVMLVGQTLDTEYCGVLELEPDGNTLCLRAGTGWREGSLNNVRVAVDVATESGYALVAGEPVVVEDLAGETRFQGSGLLSEHGVVSGVTVAIAGQGRAYGILGAHTTRRRQFTEDEVHFLLAVATVLAMAEARRRAETEIQKQAAFVQLNPNPAMELGTDGTVTYANDAAFRLAASVGHGDPQWLLPKNVLEVVSDCLAEGRSRLGCETQVQGRTLSWWFHPVVASRVVHAYGEDITEPLSLEAQLQQAQKMESVGRVAAGVAHDFNNMLTVIHGYAAMLLARPEIGPQVAECVQPICFAAERAASLTRQLLMFSRKNVMQPRRLDLREVVATMSQMLKRLLGETVVLQVNSPPELPLIQGDPGMIEQVVMNLAVNARDAMPTGGSLTILTVASTLGAADVTSHPEARPGHFVCLSVRDTGMGMDPATRVRIFEPFFTTKEAGKGTGLGLATVYTIVKRHQGWIEVESAPGQGTTFRIFFPASGERVAARPSDREIPVVVRGGDETILVVEDEAVLRELACVILQERGYRILQASSGVEALRLWELHSGSVDLLLSDMVLPDGMSGTDLAHQLQVAKPGLKVIFASGYNVEELQTSFWRKNQATFLQKPYTPVTLASAVRDCLDRP
jgi:signal transduction histidine kinase